MSSVVSPVVPYASVHLLTLYESVARILLVASDTRHVSELLEALREEIGSQRRGNTSNWFSSTLCMLLDRFRE